MDPINIPPMLYVIASLLALYLFVSMWLAICSGWLLGALQRDALHSHERLIMTTLWLALIHAFATIATICILIKNL
jgi:hypothetical protein